jgi:hypothetical protein
MSDSIVRLFATEIGTFLRKSLKLVKRSFCSRARLDLVDDRVPDVAHGTEAESDVVADGGEEADRLVDVWGEHLDAHAAALVEIDRQLVLRVGDACEEGRHVLGRIVRLEIRRPVGDHTVRGGMRLVEGVVGERQEDVPQRLDRVIRVPALPHAGAEALELLVEL